MFLGGGGYVFWQAPPQKTIPGADKRLKIAILWTGVEVYKRYHRGTCPKLPMRSHEKSFRNNMYKNKYKQLRYNYIKKV